MSTEHATSEQETKRGSAWRRPKSAGDLSLFVVGTALEVLGGVAHASAEAFQTVNTHVSAEHPNVVEGMLKGNARFLEEMSHTMNTVAERFRPRHTTGSDQSADSTSTSVVPRTPSV